MFPIPWNFPFRKKNGDLSTISDVINSGGGGGSDLPPHDVGDAGKLLGIDSAGKLEWTDDVSSEIQTLTNKVANITNPNLLDNPWFTVNQREFTTIAKGSNGYTVDRWKKTANAGSISISNGIITIDGSEESSNGVVLDQYLENIDNLIGKIVTVSLLLSDNSIVYGSNTIPSSGNIVFISLSNVSVSLNSVNSSPYFRIRVTPALTVSIKAVKLEIGDISTLAMDTAPNYATELLKCQRYYVKINKPAFFNGYSFDATTARFNIILPAAMRIAPTITLSDITGMQVVADGNSQVLTASQSVSRNGFNINILAFEVKDLATPISANIPIFAKLNNSYIELSADL